MKQILPVDLSIESPLPFVSESLIIRPVPVHVDTPNLEIPIPKNQCVICLQFFKSLKGLKQHQGKRHSTKEKTVNCSYCAKSFYHKHALKFHINQVHLKTTRIQCSSCSKIFYNKYLLKEHTMVCEQDRKF